METELTSLLNKKNELIVNGKLIEAAEEFYADDVVLMYFDGKVSSGKNEALEKIRNLDRVMAEHKIIRLHHSAVSADTTFAEFTFHFTLREGTSAHVHEIVRSIWENGKITEEQYFKA